MPTDAVEIAPRIEKQSSAISRRGGRRPGAGRPKGRKNAATLEIEAAAKRLAGDALAALKHVALKGKSESARVAAATALLDRGYGRPKQALDLYRPDDINSLTDEELAAIAAGRAPK